MGVIYPYCEAVPFFLVFFGGGGMAGGNMSSLAPLGLTVDAAFWGYNTGIHSKQYANHCFSPFSAAFSSSGLCGGDAAEVRASRCRDEQ